MKKIFLSLFVMSTLQIYAQKTINIFNYSSYNLINSLVGADQTNNCYPSISGTNYPIPVPPSGAVSYTGYYNSQLQSPSINTWDVILAPNNGSVQPSNSPLLIALGASTDWMMNKFYVSDPSGAPLYYSGASIGTIGCGNPLVTSLTPTPTTPYPFEAFWFVAGGQTYFVIQP
ncbi:hypothetical protein JI747_013460 [Chryseobacterium sp. RG1]|uniref:Uncharacterized protein n=1 Tax=Chryseobacterium tagetis TaxID=2801334 RepID=A0ABS8A2J5_9FLAO|nr:hypothetical protein [Chryseobacterium tagetis]MCA6068196.1 hypothetical protein [Chryseobacterium tagetis]